MKLYVRNQAQMVLMNEELKGQISDGLWENTRPLDAWEAWQDAEVVVRPELVGRDFHVLKDNYKLNDRRLLEVCADRMIEAVRVRVDGQSRYDMDDLLRDLRDLKKIMKVRLHDEPGQRVANVTGAVADGHGGWVESDSHGPLSEQELDLVKDAEKTLDRIVDGPTPRHANGTICLDPEGCEEFRQLVRDAKRLRHELDELKAAAREW